MTDRRCRLTTSEIVDLKNYEIHQSTAHGPPGQCTRDLVALTDIDLLQRDLVRDLAQVIDMLQRQGESRWAAWLAEDRDLIRQGDIFGIDHLLSAFAGLGSINDLWLKRTNWFTPSYAFPDESLSAGSRAQAANETFKGLLVRIWEEASLMRRVLKVRDHDDAGR